MACPPCKRKNKCVCLYKLTLRYQPCSLVITKFHNILFHYFCIVILFKTLLEVYCFALYQDLVHPLLTVYFQQRNSSFAFMERGGWGSIFRWHLYGARRSQLNNFSYSNTNPQITLNSSVTVVFQSFLTSRCQFVLLRVEIRFSGKSSETTGRTLRRNRRKLR